ncbi:hypothetical protein N3K66_001599 [Trichothecium roseum]|uniref:Uncharacterized protein n=1 Tax=Trichothecium roseum TaxID=47278 RepID=A0ACC0VGW0_9HYPO|nr:hypothetical protein N3K66_001599 [Trichothecium roseum]
MANVLITGGSGYLGGDILSQLPAAAAELPFHGKIYALVRTAAQADSVRQLGLEPLAFDAYDAGAVEDNVLRHEISVVFWLVDPFHSTAQLHFIGALTKLKQKNGGGQVHFLHTSGAKIFSSLVDAPTDRALYDDEDGLFDVQKKQEQETKSLIQKAVETNNKIIEASESAGVRSYVFVPCIVYGESRGFGNKISIQTVAIIKAAKALRRVYKIEEGRPEWPVSHVSDTTALYLAILRGILAGDDDAVGHGKRGYYLASSGPVAWDDIYASIAKGLHERGLVDDASVELASEEVVEKMAAALQSPKGMVPIQISGKCTLTASHGHKLGWKPVYPPQHILETADEEVELVLKHI